MKEHRHAEIAGGGIAGLTAAIALAQRGWSVRLHERSPSIRAVGAGIYIWENGLRVLSAVGAYDEALIGCHQGTLRETRDERNRLVASARWTKEPGRRVVSLSRSQLLKALLNRAQALGVRVMLDSEAIAATPDGELRLRDGAVLKADLVVAADGVNSMIRDSLGLVHSRARHADGAIRVVIPRTEAERSPDGGKYVEYWSGHRRILYTPCNDNDLYLALTTLDSDEAGKALPLDVQEWTRSFPHLAPLLSRIGEGGRWDVFETIRLTSWSSGRVAIVGDAAHAQAPNLGQGGGCSLMNALSLAVALEQDLPVPDALKIWERNERPLTEHTQRVTAMYGRIAMLPARVRTMLLKWIGKSKWAMSQRLKTVLHRPTGTLDQRV